MATVNHVQEKENDEIILLTPAQLASNEKVNALIRSIHQCATVEIKDFKARQLTDGTVGSSVYSPQAANRTDINALATLTNDLSKKCQKMIYTAGKAKTSSGFTIPNFVLNDKIMTFMGYVEGQTPLWPQGSRPMMSSGIFTSFIGHYVTANNLANKDDPKKFHANAPMAALLSPYIAAIDAQPPKLNKKKGIMVKAAPIDLNSLDFPTIQKFGTYFVQSSKSESAVKNGSANLNRNTEDGRILAEFFDSITETYTNLRNLKLKWRAELKLLEKTSADYTLAELHFREGIIPERGVQKYAAYKAASEAAYNKAYGAYTTAVQQSIGLVPIA
jgi:hypothetical protein